MKAGSHAEGQSTVSSFQAHAEGNLTTASNQGAHSEGQNSTASNNSSHAEGYGTTASGVAAHAEGWFCLASTQGAHAQGSYAAASRVGQSSQAGYGILLGGAYGEQQTSVFQMGKISTTAASVLMGMDNPSGSVYYSGTQINMLTIPVNTAWAFDITAVAKRKATESADEVAGWKIKGIVARTLSGAVRLVGTPTVETWADSGASAWTLVATADDVNKALQLVATGEASKTVYWSARVAVAELNGV